MLPVNQFNNVGEHAFTFKGMIGELEAVLTVPAILNERYVAILGHPHSLQGGTMNNKVVTTMARAFKELSIPCLRFNFRGVGHSAGSYDAGIGESEDMLLLKNLWTTHFPHCHVLYAGFSFGSYVTYRAAALSEHNLLITIAPPVHHYNYREFSPPPQAWNILQGEVDDVVPLQEVLDFVQQSTINIPLIRFVETGHFFHGNLLLLKSEIMTLVQKQVLQQ